MLHAGGEFNWEGDGAIDDLIQMGQEVSDHDTRMLAPR